MRLKGCLSEIGKHTVQFFPHSQEVKWEVIVPTMLHGISSKFCYVRGMIVLPCLDMVFGGEQ